MFLLVPAHPGFPGQIPQSRKTVVCCVVCCVFLYHLNPFVNYCGPNMFDIRLQIMAECTLKITKLDWRTPRIFLIQKSGNHVRRMQLTAVNVCNVVVCQRSHGNGLVLATVTWQQLPTALTCM